ncbi:hypothetical protein [Arthrobacter sp. SAFR-179]|uniref:hypothetical protein n=1 Tax=Arthrobacter sp. SAFR-179 TaxID=3387279 RepID=UPI003F7BA5AA
MGPRCRLASWGEDGVSLLRHVLEEALQVDNHTGKAVSAHHLGRDLEAQDRVHGQFMVRGEQARAQLLDSKRQLGQEAVEEEEPALIVVELGAQPRQDGRIDEEPPGIIMLIHLFLIFQQVFPQNSVKS